MGTRSGVVRIFLLGWIAWWGIEASAIRGVGPRPQEPKPTPGQTEKKEPAPNSDPEPAPSGEKPEDKEKDAKTEAESKEDEEKKKQQKERLDKLLETGPLAEVLKEMKAKLKDFETLLEKVPELKDHLEKGTPIAQEEMKKRLRELLLTELGFRPSPVEGGPTTVPNVKPKPFEENAQGFMPAPQLEPPPGPRPMPRGPKLPPGGGRSHSGGGGGGGGGRPEALPRNPGAPFGEAINSPLPTGELVKADNGRKSFELVSYLGQGRMGHCQATLYLASPVSLSVAQPGSFQGCFAATAAHCVVNDSARRVQGFQTAYGHFNAENVFFPPGDGTTNSDIAAIQIPADACEKMKAQKVPFVPLCSSLPPLGSSVAVETRYFGKRHFGTVTSRHGATFDINVNYLSRETGQHQGGIHTGDSGGPLLAVDPQSGEECLAGVLTASESEATVHQTADGRATVGGRRGFYNANLDFLRSAARL